MKNFSRSKLIRLVLIIAIVVSVFALTAIVSSAASGDKLIYAARVSGLFSPEAGRVPDHEISTDSVAYTANVQWFEIGENGNHVIHEGTKAHAGKAYEAAVHVRAAEGYVFDIDSVSFQFKVNGTLIKDYTVVNSKHLIAYIEYPVLKIQPVKEVNITIKAPMPGANPDYYPEVVGDAYLNPYSDGNFENGIIWRDAGTNRILHAEDEFVGGRTYMARFYLVADDDHTFDGALSYCVSVNGRLTTLTNSDTFTVNGTKFKMAHLTFTVPEAVTEFNVTDLYSVAAGASPDFYLGTDNADIVVREITWGHRVGNEYVSMDESDVFADGESYLLTVRVQNTGKTVFQLDENGNPDIYSVLEGSRAIAAKWQYRDDEGFIATHDPNEYAELRFVYNCEYERIDQIDIYGITIPVAGENPSVGNVGIYQDSMYVYDLIWYHFTEVDGVYKYVEMDANDAFEMGESYSVSIVVKIKADSYAVFNYNEEMENHWVDATVNGKNANGVYKYWQGNSVVDPLKYVSVSCSFNCNSEIIDNVDMVVTAPVVGEKPSYDVTFLSSGYKRDPSANGSSGAIINGQWVDLYYAKQGVSWYDVTNDVYGTEVYENQSFIGGHRYELRVTLLPTTNNTFAADNENNSLVAATVNGMNANVAVRGYDSASSRIQVTYVFECPVVVIDEIDITITTPVIGELPSYDKIVTDMYYSEKDESWNEYTDLDIGLLWLDETANVRLVPGVDRFKDNNDYSVVVKLVIKEGYELDIPNLQLYVNGCRVDMGFAIGNTVVLSFTFDRTECYHNIVAVAEKPASCLDDGMIAHYKCDKCGQLYADANGEQLIDEGEDWTIIRAEGHTFDEAVPAGVDIHTAICSVCGAEEEQECIYGSRYVEGPSEYSKYNATVFVCQCGAFSHLLVRPGDCDHEFSDWIGREGSEKHYRICACETVREEEACELTVEYISGPSNYSERDVILSICSKCGVYTMTPVEGEPVIKDSVVDEDTNISFGAANGSSTVILEGVSASVESVDESNIPEEEMDKIASAVGGRVEYVAGYDMCLVYHDVNYAPNGSIEVTIPIENYDADACYYVCYMTDEYQFVDTRRCVNYDEHQSIVFETDHFSIYVIVSVEEPVHQHNFVDGKCECGEEDPNYVPEHKHNFVDGKCECGEEDPDYVPEHKHNFVDGKCECGEEDPDYVPEHKHNFVDGKCECGEEDPDYEPEHEHEFVDGECECGEVDHDQCEASGWTKFWNAIINFFRSLFGLPEKCVCGKENN